MVTPGYLNSTPDLSRKTNCEENENSYHYPQKRGKKSYFLNTARDVSDSVTITVNNVPNNNISTIIVE